MFPIRDENPTHHFPVVTVILIALNIMGLYTAKIYSVFWASNRAFGKLFKPNHLPLLCVGLVVYFALTLIPIFGTVVAIAAMLFGLGAGILAQTKRSSRN